MFPIVLGDLKIVFPNPTVLHFYLLKCIDLYIN